MSKIKEQEIEEIQIISSEMQHDINHALVVIGKNLKEAIDPLQTEFLQLTFHFKRNENGVQVTPVVTHKSKSGGGKKYPDMLFYLSRNGLMVTDDPNGLPFDK